MMAVSSTSSGSLKTGVCLSTDRPDNPYNGQVIYETDTNRTLIYDNSAWVVISDPSLLSYSGTGATVTADAMTVAGENVTPYTGRRNLLYNGAMQVAQRGTSETGITSSGYYTADRWSNALLSIGTWSQSLENDAPTGSGFRKSLKMLCTTADAAPAAGDFLIVNQVFEGQDLQQIKKGTSAAEQLTVSFWVKSNVTGTYIVELQEFDNTRCVSASYSVAASGTWEKKTITFPADTTGALDNDNAASLSINFWLGAGSNFTSGTLSTTWASTTAANRAVGQTNLAAATSNYWQITGVQLEVGNKATPFEHRSFGEELALCKRYFETSYAYGTAFGTDQAAFPTVVQQVPFQAALGQTDGWGCIRTVYTVTKRATPSVAIYRPDGVLGSIQIVYGSTPSSTYYTPTVAGNQNGHMVNTSTVAAGSLIKVAYHYTASAEL